MVLLPTRRIFDFSTSCVAVDIATSGRLSDTYVLITFELIFSYFGRENGGTNASTTHMRGREIV